jgi:hypothetical protein
MLNSKRIGFSHFMEGCLVGEDEAEFLTAPFPLEPTSES